ncbi:hypothetical protein HanRHA438_Chr16g0778761 [Helianthus annuus]|nr:hypothetical protein HanRHA438_Chr16g0778761 [Helianthus annuus]
MSWKIVTHVNLKKNLLYHKNNIERRGEQKEKPDPTRPLPDPRTDQTQNTEPIHYPKYRVGSGS